MALTQTSPPALLPKKRRILLSSAITLFLYTAGTLLVLYTIFAFGLQNTQLGTLVATVCLYGGLLALGFEKRWGWLLIAFFQAIVAYSIPASSTSLIMLTPAIFFAWKFFTQKTSRKQFQSPRSNQP
jgi:hypothetical protein